jgi:hypothetical protein
MLATRGDNLARQLYVDALEPLAAALVQDARQIDDRIDRRNKPPQCPRIVHVHVHHIHGRQQDQVFGALAAPRRHADEHLLSGEMLYNVTAQEAAATDNANGGDLHVIENCGRKIRR